jgi:gas vesicle protein
MMKYAEQIKRLQPEMEKIAQEVKDQQEEIQKNLRQEMENLQEELHDQQNEYQDFIHQTGGGADVKLQPGYVGLVALRTSEP